MCIYTRAVAILATRTCSNARKTYTYLWKRVIRAAPWPTTASGRLPGVDYWGAIQCRSSPGLGGGQPSARHENQAFEWNFTSIVDFRQPTRGCSLSLKSSGTALESSDHPLSFKYRFSGRLGKSWWPKSCRRACPLYMISSILNLAPSRDSVTFFSFLWFLRSLALREILLW